MNPMTAGHLDDIVVFPMSGYINRLQTIASAAIMAERANARLRVCWIPFELAPSPANAVFDASFCDRFVITPSDALWDFGLNVDEVPLYVKYSDGVASLRGADVGEQALMSELERVMSEGSPHTLAIVSGGTFFSRSDGMSHDDFRRKKSEFYRRLPLHPAIEESVRQQLATHPLPFLGLHLRYTDRARQAPIDRSIKRALLAQSNSTGISSVFIAADSTPVRDHWVDVCSSLGLSPWFVEHASIEREDPLSAHPALIDWKILGNASRLVYFTASSFAVEAAVMSASWSTSSGLDPHWLRAGYLHIEDYARAGLRRLLR